MKPPSIIFGFYEWIFELWGESPLPSARLHQLLVTISLCATPSFNLNDRMINSQWGNLLNYRILKCETLAEKNLFLKDDKLQFVSEYLF